ncbi:hypothetical protein [Kineobactrum salinum]|uniref:Amidohydrolase family protein n=1 Tax=Kineobactrum salinum TaxID=2708301 RepID=A0A6C0TXR9_9GAMM|nr:hypothetical protein [Kineobactrum salinum]QIB64591.1 hypothetical protein G3T16_03450 [Kineobactrum salinum]
MGLIAIRRGLVLTTLLLGLVACAERSDPSPAAEPVATAPVYDLLLSNGTVVDGSGAQRYTADVALSGGRIAAIAAAGELDPATARQVLDVSGKVVAPGFIDVHSHADWALDDPATASIEGFLRQGVTTGVYGVDGSLGLQRMRDYAALGEEGAWGSTSCPILATMLYARR